MKPPKMFRSGVFLTATLLAALTATGCAPTETGSSEPSTEDPTTSQHATPSVTIENPKNLQAVTDACSLLTSEQLATLGMKAEPRHKESALGIQSCDWSGDEFAMTIIPDTKSGGIDQLYKGSFPLEKSTVSGYPAAWLNKTSILCRVEVGVAENAKFAVSYAAYVGTAKASTGTVKPCKRAEKIAAMVLKNIPDA